MSKLVPDGWEVKKLGEYCFGIRGVSYKPTDLSPISTNTTVTLLRANNIQESGMVLEDVQFVSRQKVKEKQIAQINDIAICMSNGSRRLVGKSISFGISPNTGTYTIGAFCSIFRSKQYIHSEFIKHLFHSQDFLSQVGISLVGSAINNLKNSDIEEYTFRFPPPPEQQKIASILTSVDEVIEKTQSQINKLQDLKKGTMNELLTRGIGHTEFKDSLVGRIPKGWEVKRLGEIVSLQYGKSPRHIQSENGDYRIVGTGGVVGKGTDYLYDGESIVIGRKGTIDKPSFMQGQFWAIDTTYYTDTYCGVLPKWLFYVLVQEGLSKFNEATGVPSLNRDTLNSIPTLIPPLPEQNKITSILSSIDNNIEETQRKLQQTKSLKKSLMQDLLTGKVRVSVH